jgi:hypothetical protein
MVNMVMIMIMMKDNAALRGKNTTPDEQADSACHALTP